jgi:hypothetical protein
MTVFLGMARSPRYADVGQHPLYHHGAPRCANLVWTELDSRLAQFADMQNLMPPHRANIRTRQG